MSTAGIELREPRLVWLRFLELTRISRPPRHEEQVREHVLAWAAEHGFRSAVDSVGNVLVRVPASPGRERVPTVALQAHLDMVCERDPDSPYDPREGRIRVARSGDWVYAKGTTLGADNGIGVAAAMAAAEDPAIQHGPLELLLTVCEEEGLEGAKALDPSLVSARLLVNLDGTSDGAITIGCAGSAHTFVRVALEPTLPRETDTALRVRIFGARGGHSGGDIAHGRANAIEALGRILRRAHERTPFGLVRLDGGVSRNAIPREAEALVVLPGESVAAFRGVADAELVALRTRHAGSDDGLAISIEDAAPEDGDYDTVAPLLGFLTDVPLGVVAMSPDVPEAVETSTSLNVARTERGVLTLSSMTRSADPERLEDTVAEIEQAAERWGAAVETVRSYPPWRPDLGSSLLVTARDVYRRLFGADPGLEVVHGGLECAVLGGRLPGLEMISLGPEIVGPHAPGERLSISGTERFYQLLGALLDDLSR